MRTGQLSAGHARPLVGRGDAEALAARAVNLGLSVRQVEALTQERTTKPKRQKRKDADTKAAETELHDALGLDVEIRKGKGEKGELRIRYAIARSARGRSPPAAAPAEALAAPA